MVAYGAAVAAAAVTDEPDPVQSVQEQAERTQAECTQAGLHETEQAGLEGVPYPAEAPGSQEGAHATVGCHCCQHPWVQKQRAEGFAGVLLLVRLLLGEGSQGRWPDHLPAWHILIVKFHMSQRQIWFAKFTTVQLPIGFRQAIICCYVLGLAAGMILLQNITQVDKYL